VTRDRTGVRGKRGVEGEKREGKTEKLGVRQRSEMILMRSRFYLNTQRLPLKSRTPKLSYRLNF
jgi:hypothetical protein